MSLKKRFNQMVLLLAALLLAGSPTTAQDCGCGGAGFAGGGSVVQGGFAPQFAQPLPAYAAPASARPYDLSLIHISEPTRPY